jgi:hypothetical protein
MMRNTSFAAVVTILATSAQAQSATSSQPAVPDAQTVNPTAVAVATFQKRVDEYLKLRQALVAEVGPAKPTTDPVVIRSRAQRLEDQIRTRRAGAKHGDIFTAAVRPAFRRLLRPEFKGEAGEDIRDSLQDVAPSPGAVPIEVNAKYPEGLVLPTTPPSILQALPRLPAPLEYRIIGKDLILLDQPTAVILDFIRNAIP